MSMNERMRPEPSDPEAVFEDIASVPPLMRENIQHGYEGRAIDWLLMFRNGSVEEDQARLIFWLASGMPRMISGSVSLTRYPWLKSLHADSLVRVRGCIRHIDTASADLDIAGLSIVEPATPLEFSKRGA